MDHVRGVEPCQERFCLFLGLYQSFLVVDGREQVDANGNESLFAEFLLQLNQVREPFFARQSVVSPQVHQNNFSGLGPDELGQFAIFKIS